MSEWEETYRKLSKEETLWSRVPEIEDFLPLAKADKVRKVLDAGCGDGKNLIGLVRESEFLCVGCDSSVTSLQICRKEVVKRNMPLVTRGLIDGKRLHELRLVAAAVDDLPFLSDIFDAAVCIDVINHCQNPYPLFDELKRVVKSGGLLYFSLFNVEDEILSDERCRKKMRQLPGGVEGREFIYAYTNEDRRRIEYYFRFLAVEEVNSFLEPTGVAVIARTVKVWKNPPHPHFRPYEHTHCNIMVTARNNK